MPEPAAFGAPQVYPELFLNHAGSDPKFFILLSQIFYVLMLLLALVTEGEPISAFLDLKS